MRALALLAVLALAGCLAPASLAKMPHTDNGGRFADRVDDPQTDRCKAMRDGRTRRDCEKTRNEARRWAVDLAVGSEFCLEGNPMSDGVTGLCKARAYVTDVGVNKVKVELRDVDPASRRYRHMQEIWYTEAALVDEYLKSLGFTASHEP